MKDSEDAKEKLLCIIKNSVRVPTHFPPSSYIEVSEKDIIKAKDHVVKSFQQHQQRTKEVKDLLRRLKDEYNRLLAQIDEKDGEIDRLQEQVADDAHLESQLEEARRKEEVLRDQLIEKDKSYQMLEA